MGYCSGGDTATSMYFDWLEVVPTPVCKTQQNCKHDPSTKLHKVLESSDYGNVPVEKG